MFPARTRAVRLTMAVYIGGFSIGLMNHAIDFLTAGPRPYRESPLGFELFWTALIGLDAIVIGAFLIGRRRVGLMLALVVMILDVLVNGYAMLTLRMSVLPIMLQATFLGFVLGSIAFLWPRETLPMRTPAPTA